MRIVHNPNWSRRGCSFLWSSTTLAELGNPSEVSSVRQFFELGRGRPWPRDLPSGNGNTLIVAGLEGCLDTLTPDDAETWLERDLKARMLAFQAEYEGQAGLVFFLANGQKRLQMNRATESYTTKALCPVCGVEMASAGHPEPNLQGQVAAMLFGPGRRQHRRKSPLCGEQMAWSRGWDMQTTANPPTPPVPPCS